MKIWVSYGKVRKKKQILMNSMHKLREKFGVDIIKTGGEL